jgi:hypothetical protein
VTTALGTRGRAPQRVAAVVATGVLADVAFDPAHRHVPLCPFHALTGWDCPFCGGLRAVNAAVRGHVAAAWHANALLWCAVPLLVWAWAAWVRRGAPPRLGRGGVVLVALVLLAFTVARNLPFAATLRPG